MKTPKSTLSSLLESVLEPAPESAQESTAPEAAASPAGAQVPKRRGAPLPTPWPDASLFVAEVVDARHPSLVGRVRVEWTQGSVQSRAWVPCVRGLAARAGDRVLVQRPALAIEPVVTGVLDGFEARHEAPRPGPSVELQADEALTITGHDGRALLQVRAGESGPVVRLLSADLALEVDGKLSLRAGSLQLEAKEGGVTVDARDDVEIRGEGIHLN